MYATVGGWLRTKAALAHPARGRATRAGKKTAGSFFLAMTVLAGWAPAAGAGGLGPATSPRMVTPDSSGA